jgi:hypothetical protein
MPNGKKPKPRLILFDMDLSDPKNPKEIITTSDTTPIKDEDFFKYRIADVFPAYNTIIAGKGTHALLATKFIETLNKDRHQNGLEKILNDEEMDIFSNCVSLINDDTTIFIRPDNEMDVVFEGDDVLKAYFGYNVEPNIKFLNVLSDRVRTALKENGYCWRMSHMPRSVEEIKKMIQDSKTAITDRKMYHYNMVTGTRYLTFSDFGQLAELPSDLLRRYLKEIAHFSEGKNKKHNPEVDFFMAESNFSYKNFKRFDFESASEEDLRKMYGQLRDEFLCAVHNDNFWTDDIENLNWRKGMFSKLIECGKDCDLAQISEEEYLGLSPEFYMHIEWLPGAKMKNGRPRPDPIFDELKKHPHNPTLRRLCDEKVLGFIENIYRIHGAHGLDYVNIGRITEHLAHDDTSKTGRQDVYIAEIKKTGHEELIIEILKMQKWDVKVYLDEGRTFLQSVHDADEYTEYVYDRLVGFRELGANVLSFYSERVEEHHHHKAIKSRYFRRDYIPGMATDKIPKQMYNNKEFSFRLAALLGKAAASNMIVGRTDNQAENVIFDSGNEILSLDDRSMPHEITVCSLVGIFNDFENYNLERLAGQYAMPVIKRKDLVPNFQEFATAYVQAFLDRFENIKEEYLNDTKSYEVMFPGRREDKGAFKYRWKKVLDRLERADPNIISIAIMKSIDETLLTKEQHDYLIERTSSGSTKA